MTNTYPSDIHPELTQDRIRHVVALIDKARREALEHFEPAKGELARSLGLRVLERMSHILLAESVYIEEVQIRQQAGPESDTFQK